MYSLCKHAAGPQPLPVLIAEPRDTRAVACAANGLSGDRHMDMCKPAYGLSGDRHMGMCLSAHGHRVFSPAKWTKSSVLHR